MKFRKLARRRREFEMCSFCGGCVDNCAAYRGKGWESYSGRGKLRLVRSDLRGWYQDDAALVDRVFTCTACRACDLNCEAGLRPSELVHAARVQTYEDGRVPPALREFTSQLAEDKNPSGRSHDARLAWRDKARQLLDPNSGALLFAGCYASYQGEQALLKILRLLAKVGHRPRAFPGERCCGLVAHQLGDLKVAQALASENLAAISDAAKDGVERVVFPCPSCLSFLLEAVSSGLWGTKGELAALDGVEFATWFDVLLPNLDDLPLRDLSGVVVTYHDPCHLARYRGVVDPPRQVLRKTGATLVEMERSGANASCCGGGGGLMVHDSNAGLEVALRRVGDALATGAEALFTACFTCRDVLEGAAFRSDEAMERELEVLHLVDAFEDEFGA
ncbi:MAG: (Fe-S)-binding protein [Promethearchaeota archaeon]